MLFPPAFCMSSLVPEENSEIHHLFYHLKIVSASSLDQFKSQIQTHYI
jgi:hypothetical protein